MALSDKAPLEPNRSLAGECEPGTNCDCRPPEATDPLMSWSAMMGIVGLGLTFCILMWNLLGA